MGYDPKKARAAQSKPAEASEPAYRWPKIEGLRQSDAGAMPAEVADLFTMFPGGVIR